MKTKQLILSLIVLQCCCTNGFSQVKSIQQTRASLLKIGVGSKLAWYSNNLKQLASKGIGTNTQGVLNSKTDNSGNKTEIGVGLTGSENGFTPQGSPRQEENGNTTCTIQPTRVNFVTSDNFNLFLASTPIYPGQMYNINSILDGTFSAPSVPARKSYQLGISIFNPNNTGPAFLDVTTLTRSPMPEIKQVLLAPNYTASIPASGVMEMSEVKSTMMLKAKFETSQGIFLPLQEFGIPAEISAGFQGSGSASNSTSSKTYLINFIQPMYTINVLSNHDQLFQSTTAHNSLSGVGYVESVTYGRRIVILIQSSASRSRVQAAVSAALSAEINGTEASEIEVGSKVSAESSASLTSIATTFHAKIYGGEGRFANAVFSDIVNFRDAFRAYITSPSAGRFSESTGALPLHYTVRRISDNALLSVRSTGSFDELISCNTARYKVDVIYEGFTVNKVIEGPGDDMEDIYGTLMLKSISTNGRTTTKDLTLKSIPKDRAISKKAGFKDSDDVLVVAMNNASRTDIMASILNFTQTMRDWEFAGEPTYRESSSSDLKFNLGSEESDIAALGTGQSKTFTKNIPLVEATPFGDSKITLHIKIKVTKN